jgi:hypothetical protein
VIAVADKKAVRRWKPYQERHPTEAELAQMLAGKVNGLAVIAGAVSDGLVVRDFDEEEDYVHWSGGHRSLAKTLPTVETKRGLHVYFRGPSGFAELANGEYRGDSKHFSVLPPSLHPSGITYCWTNAPKESIPRVDDPWDAGLLPANVKLKLKRSGSQDSRVYTTHSYHSLSSYRSLSVGTVPLPVSNSTIKCGLYKLPPREEIAIRETLPGKEGERNHCILRLVRRLHRIKDLDRSPSHLLEIISAWHSRALEVIRTKDPEPTIREFLTAFDSYDPDGSLMNAVLQTAQSLLLPPAVQAEIWNPKEEQLARLCAAFQSHLGDGPFFLSERHAAKKLGMSKTGAHKVFLRLQARGVPPLADQASGLSPWNLR